MSSQRWLFSLCFISVSTCTAAVSAGMYFPYTCIRTSVMSLRHLCVNFEFTRKRETGE